MSNKEVMSLEEVVKSDSSVEQRVYFVRGEGGLLGGSLTLANLGNHHG